MISNNEAGINTLSDEDIQDLMEFDILYGFRQMEEDYTNEEKKQRYSKIFNISDKKYFIGNDDFEKMTENWYQIEKDFSLKTKKFEDEKILTFDDKDLLVKFAPKLFNTRKFSSEKSISENIQELQEIMFTLVDKVYEYRLHKSPNYILNLARNNYPTTYQNNTRDTKIKALRKNIITILDLMGGQVMNTEKSCDLKKQLREVLKNPDSYIPEKPIIKQSKEEIKAYLFSLKLKGKTKEIEAFYNTIK